MPVLVVETQIHASPEVCFDLIRTVSSDIDKNKQIISGEFAFGQTITFINSFFGIEQKLIVKVTEYKRPHHFTDEMVRGRFKSFKHIHEFIPNHGGTLLKDTFIWASPFGLIGKIVDRLLLKNHLNKIVTRRNAELKRRAETFEKNK